MFEDNNQKRPLYIPYAGPALLETPLLNKGSAFTSEERSSFNLEGLLPQNIETIEEQAERAYRQFMAFGNDMDKAHLFAEHPGYQRNALLPPAEQSSHRNAAGHLHPDGRQACEFSNIYRHCSRPLYLLSRTRTGSMTCCKTPPSRTSR